jgi:hypothetical protein
MLHCILHQPVSPVPQPDFVVKANQDYAGRRALFIYLLLLLLSFLFFMYGAYTTGEQVINTNDIRMGRRQCVFPVSILPLISDYPSTAFHRDMHQGIHPVNPSSCCRQVGHAAMSLVDAAPAEVLSWLDVTVHVPI